MGFTYNETLKGGCLAPFYDLTFFGDGGFTASRMCKQNPLSGATCCLPCPMTDWVYPDSFNSVGLAAEWVSVVSAICCVFLLLSWAVLPVDKTHRHYLSICLTAAVMLMNLGFIVPLAARPAQCFDQITPNDMQTSSVCGASGALLILGGLAGVLWVFLRSLSLHLQICWQLVVGRSFMWFAQGLGWGIPAIGLVLALVFSGVSFRFGPTCHINHQNSLADLWIPLLVFAGITIIIQFATFGYCIKVYLASLADNSSTTEGSGMPSYTNSIRTMTPKQAYRRVRRVIQLQWRGIAIVLIIVADVIFFSVVFVFQDNTVQNVQNNDNIASTWITCLAINGGDKNACLADAGSFVVNLGTVGAVLILLAMNGFWLLFLLGRWSMLAGWRDLFVTVPSRNKREFVSVDARMDDLKKDTRSYEMLSREDSGKTMDDSVTPSVVTPISPVARSPLPLRSMSSASDYNNHGYGPGTAPKPPAGPLSGGGAYAAHLPSPDGRRTPDYFGNTARYHAPARSFSSPRPPQPAPNSVTWDPADTYAKAKIEDEENGYVNPLGMNRI